MLPDWLGSTYLRYKEDTSVFVTWLSNAAQRCGYVLPKASEQQRQVETDDGEPKTARLKGKARKEHKAAAISPATATSKSAIDKPGQTVSTNITNYEVPVSELRIQADLVAYSTSPKLVLPKGILYIIQRAIATRKQCSAHFLASKGSDSISNNGHLAFIASLESIVKTLQQPTSNDTLTSTHKTQEEKVFAVFEKEVEDVDVESTAADVAFMSSTPKAAKSGLRTYTVETSPLHDFHFDCACLFRDLHDIQAFLRSTWKSFAAGELGLPTAAMVTQAAVTLARSLEADLLARHQGSCNAETPYISLVQVMRAMGFEASYLYQPVALTLRKLDLYPHNEGAYPLSIGRVEGMSKVIKLPKDWYAKDLLKPEDDKFLTQFVIEGKVFLKARDVFASQIALDISKIVGQESKACWGGVRQHAKMIMTTLYSRPLPANRTVSPERFLMTTIGKTLNELMNWLTVTALDPRLPAIRGNILYEASRVTSSRPGLMMLEHPSRAALTEMAKMKFEKNSRGQAVGSLPDALSPEEKTDILSRFESMGATKVPEIKIPEHNFSALHMNLVQCGMMKYKNMLQIEECGISFRDLHQTVFIMAHLCHALKQRGLMHAKWEELEDATSVHFTTIFGLDLSQNLETCATRYAAKHGISIKTQAPDNRGKASFQARGKKFGPDFSRKEISKIFGAYLEGEEDLIHSLTLLEKVFGTSSRPGAAIASSSPHRNHQPMTTLAFLKKLRDEMHSSMRSLRVEYIPLTCDCRTVLGEIRAALNRHFGLFTLNRYYPTAEEQGHDNSQEIIFVAVVKDILDNAALAEKARAGKITKERDAERLRDFSPGALEVSRMIAGVILEKFLLQKAVAPPGSRFELTAEGSRLTQEDVTKTVANLDRMEMEEV
ncbi:hypothetical protein MMC25_003523 [Agyrium rufum]|nr:hypothetical protein [Agyrium rufum]